VLASEAHKVLFFATLQQGKVEEDIHHYNMPNTGTSL
jgi:hypothetical protein